MSNKKQTPLQFLSELLTNKIDKYKQLKTDVPIQELIRLKTDLLLLIQDEKELIENAFVAGSERGTKDIPFNCEQYYSQTFKKD